MNNDVRWRQRFVNFSKAFEVFCRVLARYNESPDDEITNMALVQSFEFVSELAWKTMKDYLENEGFDEVENSKKTIRVAFQAGLISDAEIWMDAVKHRNLTSHVYDAETLEETVVFIADKFFPIVRKLHEDLKKL